MNLLFVSSAGNAMTYAIEILIIFVIAVVGGGYYFRSGNKNGTSVIRHAKSVDKYVDTIVKITSVEEEDYYIDPYRPKPQSMEMPTINPNPLAASGRGRQPYTNLWGLQERNDLTRMRNARISMGSSSQSSEPVKKKRYTVKYEFETVPGSIYTGEGFFFNEKGIEVGSYIDIKYNPEKPQANYPLGQVAAE